MSSVLQVLDTFESGPDDPISQVITERERLNHISSELLTHVTQNHKCERAVLRSVDEVGSYI